MVPLKDAPPSSDQANSRKRVPSSLMRIARTLTTPFDLRISMGGLCNDSSTDQYTVALMLIGYR